MSCRITIDATSLNNAFSHFLKQTPESPVGNVSFSANNGKIRVKCTGIRHQWIPSELVADLSFTLIGQTLQGDLDFGGMVGGIQTMLNWVKADTLILSLFPNLKEWGGINVHSLTRFEIDNNRVPLEISGIHDLLLSKLINLQALSIGSSDAHLLNIDFSICQQEGHES